jgi:hypothetical protein
MDSCTTIWATKRISRHFAVWCSSIASMWIWWPTSLVLQITHRQGFEDTLKHHKLFINSIMSFSLIMNLKSYTTCNLSEESFAQSRISIKFPLNLTTFPPGFILTIWKAWQQFLWSWSHLRDLVMDRRPLCKPIPSLHW